jgi:hypothetical protein
MRTDIIGSRENSWNANCDLATIRAMKILGFFSEADEHGWSALTPAARQFAASMESEDG